MAAERQPTRSTAWEVQTGPSPSHPSPTRLSRGLGLRVSHLGRGEHFRGRQHSLKNLV